MKKIISSILVICLLTSFSTFVFADTQTSNQDYKKILRENNINEDEITILNPQDAFSEEELKRMQEEDKKLEAEGFKKATSIVFTKKHPASKKDSGNVQPLSYSDVSIVEVLRTYVEDTKTLNDSSSGMSYWLDVGWNLLIGTQTKYLWKAATVLALNPSNFLPTAQVNEKLTSTYTKVYHDFYYKKYNYIQNMEMNYVRVTRLNLVNYVDLYTFDINYNSVRTSNREETTYYTQHYFDDEWIFNEVNTRCALNILVEYIDKFE